MGALTHSRDVLHAELFEGLSPEDFKFVWSRASRREVPRESFLYREGDPARTLFLIETGRVRLYETTDDGREVLVAFLYQGEVFGAIFADAVYKATTRADTPVRAYSWTAKGMTELIGRFPRLQKNLFELTKRYMYFLRDRYRLLATASAERRVGWALAYLGEKTGKSQEGGVVITGRSVQRDIADLASTTIYTANRVLGEWQQVGALTKERGRIVLLRPLRQTDFL
jgi:CRP-like cAMP-binding protein